MDGGPVFGVGADVDVELDVAGGVVDALGWRGVSEGVQGVEREMRHHVEGRG